MVYKKQLNWFPSKGVVLKYLSPHVNMSALNMYFNKNFQIPFGSYIQVAKIKNLTNTNSQRILHKIYLQTLYNKQGGNEYIHIKNVQVITGYNVKDVPVTDLFIEALVLMAAAQGIITLKIKGNNKVPLNPLNCISELDYDDDYNENNGNDKNKNENED